MWRLQLSRLHVRHDVFHPFPLISPSPSLFLFLFSSLESLVGHHIGHHMLEVGDRKTSLPRCRDIDWQQMGLNCDVAENFRIRHHIGRLACPTIAVRIDIGLRVEADTLHTRPVEVGSSSLVRPRVVISEEVGIGYSQFLVEEDTDWNCNSRTCLGVFMAVDCGSDGECRNE